VGEGADRETVLSYVVAGGALAAGILILGDEVGRHIDNLEAWIAGLGPWALVMFVLLYAVLSSLFVPDILLGIVAGASFGFTRGVAVAAAGTLGGASLQYALARYVLRRGIDRFLVSRPALAAIQVAVQQQELRLQLLIRLTPINRALTSYSLGAVGVGFSRFATACVALLPSLCLEVYFGYAGGHLARIAGHPEHTVLVHDVLLVAGLVVAVVVMVVVSRVARRAVEAAAEVASGKSGRLTDRNAPSSVARASAVCGDQHGRERRPPRLV
jgi:uncharacterized membrane protein YdjX (TVP38/TMEM64 family)